ncbi:MAG: two-component sensor histidine kinase, partial [Sulfuricellaceae bacterium]|nr:two-component sensor histidine kinase [Sulfuricellaceae bacterium]
MNNSLQQRLSVWLSVAIVVIGLLAGGVSFWLAYNEAQEFQDDSLRQIATLVDADRLPSAGQRSAG